jgi:hypothetical protein
VEVEPVGDPAGDDVPEEARERILGPLRQAGGEPRAEGLAGLVREAAVPQEVLREERAERVVVAGSGAAI